MPDNKIGIEGSPAWEIIKQYLLAEKKITEDKILKYLENDSCTTDSVKAIIDLKSKSDYIRSLTYLLTLPDILKKENKEIGENSDK